jgi:hypothetical protein
MMTTWPVCDRLRAVLRHAERRQKRLRPIQLRGGIVLLNANETSATVSLASARRARRRAHTTPAA